MTADPLAHLDFTTLCELVDPTGDCPRPATWIADIHMHSDQMFRVAICDHHRQQHLDLETRIHPGAHCTACRRPLTPGDFIRNQEPL